jgi:Ca2+/Na+ antiporter
MIIITMTRMYSHMKDIYFETSEMIENDLIVTILFALLFVLFIMHAQLTLIELGIFYIIYRAFLIGLEEYKRYDNDLDAYEISLNDYGDDADDEEEDEEVESYDLLNFELKELKMKKKE